MSRDDAMQAGGFRIIGSRDRAIQHDLQNAIIDLADDRRFSFPGKAFIADVDDSVRDF